MRIREITLFLVFVLLVAFSHEQLGATLVEAAVAAPMMPVPGRRWRYAESSKYYDIVPADVRALTAEKPADVAEAVCDSLGGNMDMIQKAHAHRERVGFNCAFHEPGLSMTAEFGELRRIAANRE